MISSVYDPLGFLPPFTTPAKMILQDLCRSKCSCNDPIPHFCQYKWNKWCEDLEKVKDFKIRQCLKPQDFGQITSAQMHHFCDASVTAYGTVTYIRMQNDNNGVHTAFLLGKARVAPLKQMNIPCLELTAAVHAACRATAAVERVAILVR